MQKILHEQNVTDSAAGTLVMDSTEGTAAESSVGWLAVARAQTLDILLEVDPSRGRRDASRDLKIVEKIELGGRILALAACPRCSERGDDLLVAMDNLSWELVRLHPTEFDRESATEREYAGVDLSVLASGVIGSGPRGSFDASGRATSLEMTLRLDVWGASSDTVRTSFGARCLGASEDQGRRGKQHSDMKTLVACVCDRAITLLTFLSDTSDEQDRGRSGDSTIREFTSVTFPLSPDVDGNRSASKRATRDLKNLHDQSTVQQSHFRVDNRQAMPSLTMPSGASAVQRLVIISGEKYTSVEPTGDVYSTARVTYSPATIAMSLVDEGRENDGGDVACGDRTNVGRRKKFVRIFLWDLSGGGGGNLRPGHWCLANLHPDTCIAGLATGGLLCVDPHGAKAFTGDGVQLLDVGVDTPSFARGSWKTNARPVAVSHFSRELRRREPNRRLFTNGNDHSQSREDFLVADISGDLHCISVFVEFSGRASGGRTHPEERGTSNRHGSSRGGCGRIECTKLGVSFGDVPCRLRRRIQFLLPVGSSGLVFAAKRSSAFPIVIRIPTDPPSIISTGVNERVRSVLKNDRVQATTDRAARTGSWQLLERWEERLSSRSLGPVSDMTILSGLKSYEQRDEPSDNYHGMRTPAHTQPGHSSGSIFRRDKRDQPLETRDETRPRGLRMVLATGVVCGRDVSIRDYRNADDPANSLVSLEHGLRLETIAEGSVGLPVGATLFAQPVPVGNVDCPKGGRCGQSWEERRTTPGWRDEDKECVDSPEKTGHVLLLSDRVRSRTHVMFKLPSGEVAPARTVAAKGFDCGLHTIHLGRLEPLGYIVQVTAESVNIIQSPAWSEVAEGIASWRPSPLPPLCPPFKVQHAGVAGTVVAVACESTMILIEVRDVASAAAALPNPTKRTVDGDDALKTATASTTTAREVRRVELDGGPLSAMAIRSCGNNTPEEGTSMKAAPASPVLIATASWDSPAITVHSFSAPSTADSVHAQETLPNIRQVPGEHGDGTALLKNVAVWHPPWIGGSSLPSATGDNSDGTAGTTAAEKVAGARKYITSATLTRAVAFVQFKDEPERMSVVAATADGAVAVGEWQQGRSAEEDDQENRCSGGTPKEQQTVISDSSSVALVTVASFQVGQGPIRLVVFRSTGSAETADTGVEQVFVNGETMDALVHRCTKAPAPDEYLGGWQCAQVCRAGRHRRESVAHLPQGAVGMANGRNIANGFAWLATKKAVGNPRDPLPCVDPKRQDDHNGGNISAECHLGASHDGEVSPRQLSLCFGTLPGGEPRGAVCSKTPLPWTPTHLVYVPVTRSIVVAFQTNNDDNEDFQQETTTVTAGAGAYPRGTRHEMRLSSSSHLPSSSTLRIYDAETLQERPGIGPLRFLPGVRVTGIALLPGLPSTFRGTSASSAAFVAAQGMPRIDAKGRSLAMPAEAEAVGGDAIAVACCRSMKAGSAEKEEDAREATGDGGWRRHGGIEGRTPVTEDLSSVDAIPSRNLATSTSVPERPAPSLGKAASVATVLAAFEVVACDGDGLTVADDGRKGPSDMSHCTAQDLGGKGDEWARRRPEISNIFDSRNSTALMALGASPELSGACFSVEALGNRSVVVSNNDRMVVFGWEGQRGALEEDLRPDKHAPPLKLAVQDSCRTHGGCCVTALATCEDFVAVAEFLHCVCLYRFDETLRELSLVARHSRDSLAVTALELCVRPAFPAASCDVEEGGGETVVALVAVADLTTRTVAVLACPRLGHPSSVADMRGSTNMSPSSCSTNGGSVFRGGRTGSGEGATDTTGGCSGSDNGRSGDRGGSRTRTSATDVNGVGSQDPDVALLGLVSVWPCNDKVTSLASEPDFPSVDDSDYANIGGNPKGKQQEQQRHRQQGGCFSLPQQAFTCWNFFAGTVSGAVLAGRVAVPRVLKTGDQRY